MFNTSEIHYLSAWCQGLSFGNYASAERMQLRAYVAVALAAAIANVHPEFDEARFVLDCGVTQKDLR